MVSSVIRSVAVEGGCLAVSVACRHRSEPPSCRDGDTAGATVADIFISYSRPDRDLVESLELDLSSWGLTVWWDKSLETGASLVSQINKELEAAKLVCVIWTENSRNSDWVQSEAELARRAGKYFGISHNAVPPPPFLLIPYFDSTARDFRERLLEGLVRATGDERLATIKSEADLDQLGRQLDWLNRKDYEAGLAQERARKQYERFEAQTRDPHQRAIGVLMAVAGVAMIFVPSVPPISTTLGAASDWLRNGPIHGPLIANIILAVYYLTPLWLIVRGVLKALAKR